MANEKLHLEHFASSIVRNGATLARDYGAEATNVELEHMGNLEHNLVQEWTKDCCLGHAAQMLAKRFSELFHQTLIVGFHLQDKYRGLEGKIADALKAAIKEAKQETKHSTPVLSEIISAFMEEASQLTALALNHHERNKKDRRQEETQNALLLAVKANNNKAPTPVHVTHLPAQLPPSTPPAPPRVG